MVFNLPHGELALWSRLVLHSGVLNQVTTGIAELNDHLMGAQRSSSHVACAIHVVEICVHSHQNSKMVLHHKPKIMHITVKQPIKKHRRSLRHCLSLTVTY